MTPRRTFVTAAHTALGSTAVRLCLARGDTVLAMTPEPRRVLMLQDLAAEYGDNLRIAAGDAADPATALRITELLPVGVSAIDMLVVGGEEPVSESLDVAEWSLAMRRSSLAPVVVSRASRMLLKAGTGPRILAFSSLHASISGKLDGGGYQRSMAGAALNIGLRALAHDVEPDGIIVVIGDPGLYKTALHGPAFQPDAEQVVMGLLAVADTATLDTTGQFTDWNSRPRTW